jgi:lambda family phage portal protein
LKIPFTNIRIGRVKQNFILKREYGAANVGRLTSDWITNPMTMDALMRYNLRTIRARSRDLADNDPYMRKFLSMLKLFVIGQGISLQSKVKENNNGTYDIAANRIIEDAWATWGKKGNCEVTGRLSWLDVQKLVITSVCRDGEIFIRKVPNYNTFGFALQIIEADMLDEEYNEEFPSGRQIRMGVEVDQWYKPISYYFFQKNPYDYPYGQIVGQQYIKIPAEQIIHLFVSDRISQTRGLPWATPVMFRCRMLQGYEEAELVQSRIAATRGGWLKIKSGDEDQITADTTEGNNKVEKLEYGEWRQLPAGVEPMPYSSDHPSGTFSEFTKEILRGISAGLNVNYNMLSSDMESTSYAAIRAGIQSDKDFWRELQTFMIQHLCEDIFGEWLRMSLLTKSINLPFEKFAKFNAPKFIGRGFEHIDPEREVTANLTEIQAGLTSKSRVVAEKDGQDYEELLMEIKKEKELEKQYGVTFEPVQTGNPKFIIHTAGE